MTTIAWATESWNPIRAVDRETRKAGWFCIHASTGCLNCYAEAMNRYRGNGRKYRVGQDDGLIIGIDERALVKPLSWGRPRRIFVCSMTDLFLDQHTDEMIDRVMVMMAFCRRHQFLVLTKRPARMRAYLTELYSGSHFAEFRWDVVRRWLRQAIPGGTTLRAQQAREYVGVMMADALHRPLPNVWCGVSAENQRTFDERVPELLHTPAAVRWVSYEPALERIDLIESDYQSSAVHPYEDDGKLDWIVVGGESGSGARPFEPSWAEAIVDQCEMTPCKVFVKQMGSVVAKREGYRDAKGEDPSEWPAELQVRAYPRELVGA